MKGEKAKRVAAEILNTSKKKVWVDPEEAEALKDAITREDIRELIKNGTIKKSKLPSQSKARARLLKEKKRRGRKHGPGKKKTTEKNRSEKKKTWIKNVRAQRKRLRELRAKNKQSVEKAGYSKLYRMIKGNYFRGKRYLESYVKEEGAGK